ncbi:hypothetical protein [uncultured Helicobacter sp.]|uniref:hypothetical protein n=1 Tax=uncultured Helicobacter sp. TaxID=175537 RepID=UPI003752040D
MHEIADIFEPITPWSVPLTIIGVVLIFGCVSGAWLVLKRRKNPLIKRLKSLDVRDSKQFAKEFSALVQKARTERTFAPSTLAQLEEFSQRLAPYKFPKNPPPLDSLLLSRYQRLCEIL